MQFTFVMATILASQFISFKQSPVIIGGIASLWLTGHSLGEHRVERLRQRT